MIGRVRAPRRAIGGRPGGDQGSQRITAPVEGVRSVGALVKFPAELVGFVKATEGLFGTGYPQRQVAQWDQRSQPTKPVTATAGELECEVVVLNRRFNVVVLHRSVAKGYPASDGRQG